MRDAELTRQKILEISADEIHKKGFIATSLSCILVRCEVSKGALYHHFKNKMELGYAVFEEIYTPMFLELWQPAVEVDDPIEGLCDFFTAMYTNSSCDEIVCGCPLNNLCQEMSGVDEGFRLRILNMQQQLNQLIAINLQRVANQLRDDIDFSQVAYFIVSTFHGSSSLSKSSKNKDLFEKVIKELCNYIRNLRSH
ncbi:MAG: TetR/AcrR family transcriptional repressor of nem operon [Colwellia sp.]|jgi:AcrR family transcriptional regulator|uniref:TetR/AcrR family transcriptional regulator n=1 Tax=unclassified Colwellia TaxID=196834 RepID=UPI0008780105|nr:MULTISPECIES: TetR/AcrR family transcriptional regulator [unclassified Colwellia]MBA6364934.1 TetR/AcrR family transcriptional regulator [Colwellia sp. BRX8-8]AOW76357.1 TetR family transcriptional regulator [Colwellia sp. PAMC 20917]MBA6251304.1 TetR/AcrR family transcriptional regulator [Colwellia sp. MB3u-55]MBA6339098.1 TetR/AcrR family transcriptional regulator [Colwellia sp. BRX8-7]MBA6349782.1 TetR/AcrR family transcriptional regulator [Colwellia sp. BRX8-9]|tara:strand:- start:3788 stop:4375 length:588 start_codon:yes stop_codon:yes gene_type:complete